MQKHVTNNNGTIIIITICLHFITKSEVLQFFAYIPGDIWTIQNSTRTLP